MLQSNPGMAPPRCSSCGAVMEPANVQPGLGALPNESFNAVNAAMSKFWQLAPSIPRSLDRTRFQIRVLA